MTPLLPRVKGAAQEQAAGGQPPRTRLGTAPVVRYTALHRAPNGRPVPSVAVEDARNIYRRAHMARVGVLVVDDAWVRRDPSHAPDLGPQANPLERFVRYKTYCACIPRARLEAEIDNALAAFLRWCEALVCYGEHDPRSLPLHVFQTDHGENLYHEEGRRRFAAEHGHSSKRRDGRRAMWKPALAQQRHGGADVLHVAGRALPLGFHWDVAPQRDAARICTANEVWQVEAYGHVNVYPDAHVREGKGARLVWPR